MPDNLIQVGAQVDLGAYQEGMQQAVATTETSMAEVSQSFETHSARSTEALHGIALGAEETGIKVNRHTRAIIAQLPGMSKAFELAFPVIGAVALFEIMKQVGDKIGELISDNFIFTESEKNVTKQIAAENSELEKLAAHTKAISRQRQLDAANGAKEKTELKLKFAIEDGGEPAKLAEQMKIAQGQLKSANEELDDALAKIDDWTLKSGAAYKEFEEATEKVNRLNGQIVLLSKRLKDVGEVTAQISEQGLKQLTAETDAATAKREAAENKYLSLITTTRGQIMKISKQVLADQEKNNEEGLRDVEKTLQEEIRANDEKLAVFKVQEEEAKNHEQALQQIASSHLEFERQMGRLSETSYEQILQKELDDSYAKERADLQLKLATAKEGTADQARIYAELEKLDDKYHADTEKAEQQSLLRRKQTFDQYFQQLSGSFNTAINGWITGTQTAAQAFGQMFQSIETELISFVEKWIEKKIEMWILDKILGDSGQQAQLESVAASNSAMAMSDAFLASANAYAPLAWNPPAAAAAATLAYGVVGGFALGAGSVAAFEMGGIVPQTGFILAHQGEKVLPASMSGTGAGLSGGHTFNINLNVSAMDGDSVANVYNTHLKKRITRDIMKVINRKP